MIRMLEWCTFCIVLYLDKYFSKLLGTRALKFESRLTVTLFVHNFPTSVSVNAYLHVALEVGDGVGVTKKGTGLFRGKYKGGLNAFRSLCQARTGRSSLYPPPDLSVAYSLCHNHLVGVERTVEMELE